MAGLERVAVEIGWPTQIRLTRLAANLVNSGVLRQTESGLMDIKTDSWKNGQTDRQTDTHTHTHRQTDTQTDTQTRRHADRQTDTHTHRQTDRQTHTQTDRQTDRHKGNTLD